MLRVVGWLELAVAITAFLAACGIVAANALLRFAFNRSLVWSEEAALLATNSFVFVGGAVIMKARADVSVSVVLDRLPSRSRAAIQAAILALAVAFFACLLAASLSLWPLQRNTTTFILDISRYWYTLPLVWAALSMLVTAIYQAAVTFAWSDGVGGRTQILQLPREPG